MPRSPWTVLVPALVCLALAPDALAQRTAPRVAPRLSVPAFEWGRAADHAARRSADVRGGTFRTDPSPGGSEGGYLWFDSNEAALRLRSTFESIVGDSDTDNLGLSDNAAALVLLPFTFEFYGDVYGQVAVHSNGLLSFTSTAAIPQQAFGDISEPNTVVAPYWIDLNPEAPGAGVYTLRTVEDGRTVFIVEWNDVPFADPPSPFDEPLTFQAKLYEDGEIRFVYPFDFAPSGAAPSGSPTGIENQNASRFLDIGAQLFNSSLFFVPQDYEIVIQPPLDDGLVVAPRSPDGVTPVDFAVVTEPCGSQPSRVQEFAVRSTGTGGGSVTPSIDGDPAFVLLTESVSIAPDEVGIVRVALVGQEGDTGTKTATLNLPGVSPSAIRLQGLVIGATPDAHARVGGGYRLRTSVAACSDTLAAPAVLLPFGPAAGDRPLSISFSTPDSLALPAPFRLYGEPYAQAYVNTSGSITFEAPATPGRLILDLPPGDGAETAVVAPAVYAYVPLNPGTLPFPVRGAAYGGVRDVTGDDVPDLVVTFYRVRTVFGGHATWQAVLAPGATPGASGSVRVTTFAGPDPADSEGGLYTVLADRPDGLNSRSVAGVSGDQAALAFEVRARTFVSDGGQPALFDESIGAVAFDITPRTETIVGAAPGPFRAGTRLLSAPAAGMTVGMLAEQNLVQGLVDSYPRDGAGATALPNLLTSYDGATGYARPAGLGTVLVPGEGFFWQFYDLDIVPDLDPGNSQSVALPTSLVAGGTPQTTTAVVPLTASSGGEATRWEMVGNPFEGVLDLTGIAAWAVGGTLGSAVGQLWDPATRSYVPTALQGNRLQPWQGMFIEGGTATALAIPPSAIVADEGRATAAATVAFSLAGEAAGGTPTLDRAAVLVVADGAEAGWDLRDASKLGVAAPFATLAFAGDRAGVDVLKAQESRPPGAPFAVPLAVDAAGVTGALVLSWSGTDALPADWSLRLRDTVVGTDVDLRAADRYAFTVPARPEGLAGDGLAGDPAGARPVPHAARPGAAARFVLSVTPGRTVGAESDAVPETVELRLAGPNPVRARTQFRVALPAAATVEIAVYDALGRRVAQVADRALAAGEHAVAWDASGLAAGAYVVRMRTGGDVRSVRVIVAR